MLLLMLVFLLYYLRLLTDLVHDFEEQKGLFLRLCTSCQPGSGGVFSHVPPLHLLCETLLEVTSPIIDPVAEGSADAHCLLLKVLLTCLLGIFFASGSLGFLFEMLSGLDDFIIAIHTFPAEYGKVSTVLFQCASFVDYVSVVSF